MSVECINSPATVLNPADYEKNISLVSKKLSSSVYICSREFKKKKGQDIHNMGLYGYYN